MHRRYVAVCTVSLSLSSIVIHHDPNRRTLHVYCLVVFLVDSKHLFTACVSAAWVLIGSGVVEGDNDCTLPRWPTVAKKTAALTFRSHLPQTHRLK